MKKTRFEDDIVKLLNNNSQKESEYPMKFLKSIFTAVFLILPTISMASTVNVRTSPLGLLIGSLTVEADFPINSHWTAGPTFSTYRFDFDDELSTDDISVRGSSFGARAIWHKNGIFTDGLYLSPQVAFASATAESNNDKATVSGIVAAGVVGYGWFWPGGFNMLLGGGPSFPIGDLKAELNGEEYNAYPGSVGLALEWTAGWVF
ncbi:MAG: hypothetical protein ACLGGX_04740 [Bdellovibrionia bacterium]